MLWAIDVGNTQTSIGLHDGEQWVATLRVTTRSSESEDELAAKLSGMATLGGWQMAATSVAIASVVPERDRVWHALCEKWLKVKPRFLRTGDQVGLTVTYDPPHAVGADRLANAVAALQEFTPPILIVDFGTATTFDAIDRAGAYVGGAILPGPMLAMESLATRTSKLPRIELAPPLGAIGTTTIDAIRSGVMHGCGGGIDRLCELMTKELGELAVLLATGGLAPEVLSMCAHRFEYRPLLTLDGIRLFATR